MYYRNAQAAIVVYDVTKATSLEKAKTWVKELQRQANPNIVIALAGNKIDLVQNSTIDSSSPSDSEDEAEADDATATPGETGGSPVPESENVRQVSREEAEAYAQEAGLLFFEISAKTGEGITEIFTEIGTSAPQHSPEISNHTDPYLIAKKIPIEHILASTRGAGGRGGATGGRPGATQQGGVNLEENANKARDACNC